jgi:hypothetical protein
MVDMPEPTVDASLPSQPAGSSEPRLQRRRRAGRAKRRRIAALITVVLATPAVYFGVFRTGRCTDRVEPLAPTKAGEPMMFPTIRAKTLAGRCVVFPQETAGKVGVIFVAFEQGAQQDINTWIDPLIASYLESPDVEYYEIPMISTAYRPVARFIDGGMRGGVPADLHDRTATFYGDRSRFFSAAAITDQTRPYLFVLSRSGRVVYRTDGPVTTDSLEAARQAIDAETAKK